MKYLVCLKVVSRLDKQLNLIKYDRIRLCFKILIVVWLIIFIGLIIYSHHEINPYAKEEVANDAIVLGTYIANSLELSREDYQYLKSITFEELLESEINKRFEKIARKVMDISDYKYIYLISSLEYGERKYGGDVIYLLDAVESLETRIDDAKDKNYYDDDIRYDKADELLKEVEKTKISSYNIEKDKWGEYVHAYIPFYTVEGDYIGLIGIDMDIYEFTKIKDSYSSLILVFIMINLTIGLIAFFLYGYMMKAHNELKKEKQLSGTDELTHISNRRKFNEVFIELWEDAKKKQNSIALMIIDLDYFKEFNDNKGHLAGDTMLRNIGGILEKESSKAGIYAFRYGGDEFVVLLPNQNIEEGEEIANNILKAINDAKLEHPYSPIGDFQTVSIGVTSIIPKDDVNIKEFFNYADTALYLSKRYGRNRVSTWKI